MTEILKKFNQIGQSIWYDNIERKLLNDGTLSGMVNRGEIRGITSDTEKTVSEAKKLWSLVNRPNLMVKIPATKAGLPAITEAIAAGINVNVTLIFSLDRYREVREAYLTGLEKRVDGGKSISNIASVASFFISRIDSKVDKMLESLNVPEEITKIENLLGKIAVASGKLAYRDYEDTFGEKGIRFGKLKAQQAKRQRVLWASTSTKNPAYPDTKYVNEMIGPYSVNTLPPKTLLAFLDHGVVDRTIDQDLESAWKALDDLSSLDIDLDRVTQELESEGVESFAEAFTSLLNSLQKRMVDFQ
jgi:transaldolase